jgi:hypothetical protein
LYPRAVCDRFFDDLGAAPGFMPDGFDHMSFVSAIPLVWINAFIRI